MDIYNNPNFESLREYNKMDCEVLYHLLLFLRNYVYTDDSRQKRANVRNSKKRKLSGKSFDEKNHNKRSNIGC